jgi:pimeloyl-ACP methyl ester carboxylesterase
VAEANNGATLVLVNPVASDIGSWQFLGITDAKAINFPGHGGRPLEKGWTQQQMADEIVAAFPGPLDLVGVAFGGGVVQHILTRHPERVRSALIACTGPATGKADREAQRREVIERGEPALKHGMPTVIDVTFRRWFTPYAVRAEVPGVAYTRRLLLDMAPESWAETWWAGYNTEPISADALAAVEQPITIVAGIQDARQGLTGSVKLHRILRNSRLEIVPGPHMMHLEQPNNLRAALERHLIWSQIGQRVEPPLVASAG